MSVKPVAWMLNGTDHSDGGFTDVEEIARKWGDVTPLYSAPAPELAEALQRLVAWGKRSDPVELSMNNLQGIIEDSIKLLARITPK